MKYNLERFIIAQNDDYEIALNEIKNGLKQSHWIWYIFPQIKGLGRSSTAIYYSIQDYNECVEYINNPYLYNHLIEITNALLNINNKSSIDILGYIDSIKVQSSMTLFYEVSKNPLFKQVIDKYYDGKLDTKTIELLKKD